MIRIGSPDDETIELLLQRFITVLTNKGFFHLPQCLVLHAQGVMPPASSLDETVDYYLKLREVDKKVIAAFPTNAEVDVFNERVMEAIGGEIVELKAKDSQPQRKRRG